MTLLQFDILLPEGTDQAEAEAAASALTAELQKFSELEQPEAEYAGTERSVGDIVQAIMVAAPIAAATASLVKDTDTIIGFVQKILGMFKSKPENAPGAAPLRQIDLDRILFRIGDELVPATELTQAHLDILAKERG